MHRSCPKYVRIPTVVGLVALLASSAACTPSNRGAAPPAPTAAGGRVASTASANLVAGVTTTASKTCVAGATVTATTCTTDADCAAITGATCVATSTVSLTAQPMAATLRDGSTVPMWGYAVGPTGTTGPAPTWAPGPTIVVPSGTALAIQLTNALPVPTSLVVLGQLGGGLGTPRADDTKPAHTGQNFTTFPGNAQTSPAFVPPSQGMRVRSFGTEVAAGSSATLTWAGLKPGTYLYETGTYPSLQVPMGLYGVLVVTAPTDTATGRSQAYPGVAYDDDVALLFSEIDPVQNKAVQAAAVAGSDVNKRFNDPSCTPNCYPAAVNYTPTYFLLNGKYFDRTAPQDTAFLVGDAATYPNGTGRILVRLLNAGSRTHVPSIVGLDLSLVAEDGNPAPGNPKVQSEVLLTAGKTHDAIVTLGLDATGAFSPATFPVFDRQLSLSTDNHSDGGMQGFLLVHHSAAATATIQTGGTCTGSGTACTSVSGCGTTGGTCTNYTGTATVAAAGQPGNLPAGISPVANNDSYKVPFNGSVSGNVTDNDVGISWVGAGAAVSHGTLTLNRDGTFTYTPAAGYSGPDSFTYAGNGSANLIATVALSVGSKGGPPTAVADAFTSAIAGKIAVSRPGVLANDTDPSGLLLTASPAVASGPGACTSVNLNPDGSFTATGSGATCTFTYKATNSQGTPSVNAATVTVSFPSPSGLVVRVVDAKGGTAITDYRWIIQEDLTFKHDTNATPSIATRTIGTSFHRSHMPLLASGCVGAVSCGSGQQVRGAAVAPASETLPSAVALDPTRSYFISILPGDAAAPVVSGSNGHAMGGAEIRKGLSYATTGVTVRLQQTPLPTAQMSIYIYEDSNPTNGQNEAGENPLGGFNVILMDPAGRTGDVAGQQTYDAFNMPLSNALLGRPGCPDELSPATNGTGTSGAGNLVGAVYTCPNDPNAGTPLADPAKYALAGHALIQNLTPARYDVIAHPGAAREGAGEVWWQTETLEGTPAQDAFVGVNEPQYFQEFGPPGPHVTIGFVNPANVAAYAAQNGLGGTHTIKGQVTNQHMSRPSDATLWDSGSYDLLSSTTCRVVVNTQAGAGPAVAAAECAADGSFTLTGVPAGDLEVQIFDEWLDQIIQAAAVTVPTTVATVDMGNLPVLSWFTQHDQNIFMDNDGNGVYGAGDAGISNVPLTVRYRNGAPSNATLSDSAGNGILVELFPLFNWYVAEADTTRFKQTGVSIVVDGGGKPDTTGDGAGLWTSKYATGQPSTRTEQPGALSYGVQSFISQRNKVDWGRTPYAVGENGGITGYVVYSSTRPFDDQRLNVQTIWEPLVPRVKVNLYRQDTLADGSRTLTLVDTTTTTSWDDFVNRVYGANGLQYMLGSDNVLRDPLTGAVAPAAAYPPGKQVNLQCPGQLASDVFVNFTLGQADRERCYDGWHNWNQVQAAPYDGRYVFPSAAYVQAHPLCSATVTQNCTTPTAGQTLVSLPAATYVVEAVTPPGYEIVKEEDKNILIGDAFVGPAPQQFGALGSIFILPDQATLNNGNPYNPNTGDPGFQSNPTTNLGWYGDSTATIFPECAGNLHRVPDFLSLYPQAQQVAPFAGMDRPLCDRKKVVLNDQMQTSANFFVFSEVPVASNNTGIILDDATAEFNAYAPDFGEKASVPFVPVSIRDWSGMEVSRTYSDQWGAYNMMTVSSWLVNPPTPSGYGPNMLITCINDPGPVPDPSGALDPKTGQPKLVPDPAFNPAYSNFCYTNPYMPGQTTYLDTPVVPVAAFASGYNPPDCAQPDNSPVILRVDAVGQPFGPWLPQAGGQIVLQSQGDQTVLNPAYEGPFATSGLQSQRNVVRHYNFGTRGTVTFGGTPLTCPSWSPASITCTVPAVPAGTTRSGQLVVTTGAGATSVDAVTLHVGGKTPTRVTGGFSGQTTPDAPGPIQTAIDLASPGDLILVDAGVYDELVILYKPVQLQGVGAGSVVINAAKYPTSKLETWRPRINALFNVDPITGTQGPTSQVDPLPTQEITGGVIILEPTVLGSEEGAGITVLAKNLPVSACGNQTVPGWDSNFLCSPSLIDGLSVTGGDAGGGIYVNGWAHNLEIANTRVYGNAGAYNGGIRVGVPYLELGALPTNPAGTQVAPLGYDVNVHIHHNAITKNGTVEAPAGNGGAGAGLSLCSGTDHYQVDHNWVCGNYGASDGGGIGHLGFSQGGVIDGNWILFNQSFQQTGSTHGGGIFVGGEPPIAGALSLGTGDVTIRNNLVRGNLAEGGQGGGIRVQQANGADVALFTTRPNRWHQVTIRNNRIVENVAGWAGGGISLADSLQVTIANNNVSSNDSTGIAGVILVGGVPLPGTTNGTPGAGYPSPAGIVTEPTSAPLQAQLSAIGQLTGNRISQPTLNNNIIWKNRSFFYSGGATPQLCSSNAVGSAGCLVLNPQTATGQCPSNTSASSSFWDLGVLGDASYQPGALHLSPTRSDLTPITYAAYQAFGGSNNQNTPNGATSNPATNQYYCNGARIVPELAPVINPPTVKTMQVAATVDEGNNFVNLRYGPLYLERPTNATTFGFLQ